ncbi:MAG: hypothetical protein JST30_06110 [Armatimonadetes bacterium]|nr:hypothetical protein [Armatimonadota bacterium]
MVLIQAVAVTFVVAYYAAPSFRSSLDTFAAWRAGLGLLFAPVAGFLAGGVLPEIAKALTGLNRKFDGAWLRDTLFTGLVWSGLALMVDVFYGFQEQWFGGVADPMTVAKKTAMDMVVFAPLLFVPYSVAMFRWRDAAYRPSGLASVFGWRNYRANVLPTYIPNVCYWIPVLFAVYALPTVLQYPLSALATACWSLVFVFINKNSGD